MGSRRVLTLLFVLFFEMFPLWLALEDDMVRKMASQEKSMVRLPPCQACSALVKSFEAGVERTSRGKFEGGDTGWEEKNQGSGYAKSEVRLVEIQEHLCNDVKRGENQCHENHEEWEDLLETWWKLDDESQPNLNQWLCIDQLKMCCPDEHYGSKCTPCSLLGSNGQLCSGRGSCKGSGTRKGNGQCSCEKAYSGKTCERCASNYYSVETEDDDLSSCKPCHKSCLSACSGAGPKNCLACKDGYSIDTEHGCQDVNECIMDVVDSEGKSKTKKEKTKEKSVCKSNQFCVNTEGSFRCVNCDKACDGCHADGPDSCDKCAKGFLKNEENQVCVSEKMADDEAARVSLENANETESKKLDSDSSVDHIGFESSDSVNGEKLSASQKTEL